MYYFISDNYFNTERDTIVLTELIAANNCN
jgi:hypothetical protein